VAAAEAAGVEAAQAALINPGGVYPGVLTRSRKRKLLDLAESGAANAVIKKLKMEGKYTLAKGSADRQLRGTTNRRSSKGGKGGGAEAERAGQGEGASAAVIPHDQWLRERDERDFMYPATVCNKTPVSLSCLLA
jgi:hypothetical protein